MKRLIAISNHGQMIGGGEQSLLDLISQLPISWEVTAAVPQEGELAKRLRNYDISAKVLALPSLRPTHAFSILMALQSHVRTYRYFRPHLIYANGSRAAFYGGLAGRILGIPVVWHCRIVDKDPFLDALLCILSSCIIVNSNATATRFKPGIRRKIRTIYNGVDLQWLRDPLVAKPEFIRNDWKVILVVARVSRDKRHDMILSSFERVAKQDPTIHLVCLGSKDAFDPFWWDLLQQRTQQSEWKERIHWIGHVKDVRPWYKVSRMLLLASERESFGRVVVEAMACGLPVIATRVGAIPEIVRHNYDGILVSPHAPEEMAAAVLILLSDETLRNQMGRSGSQRAEAFSLGSHLEKMLTLFETMITQGHP